MTIVYILKHSATDQIYIGKTNNLERRIKEHNIGFQTSTHRKSGKWILVYAEAYRAKSDADQRELRFKQHGRAKQELLKRLQASLNI